MKSTFTSRIGFQTHICETDQSSKATARVICLGKFCNIPGLPDANVWKNKTMWHKQYPRRWMGLSAGVTLWYMIVKVFSIFWPIFLYLPLPSVYGPPSPRTIDCFSGSLWAGVVLRACSHPPVVSKSTRCTCEWCRGSDCFCKCMLTTREPFVHRPI